MATGLVRRWRAGSALVGVVFGGLLPSAALAAFASALVHNVGQPSQDLIDGFGGGKPHAQVLLSGGGPLLPFGEGQGSFIVAASASNARGDLHASVDVSTVGQGRAFGVAQASVSDTLVIGGTRPVELELRLEVQGSFFGNGQSATFSATSGLTAGALSSQGTLDWRYSNGAPNPQLQVRLTHTSGDVEGISREPGNAIVWLTTRQLVDPGPVAVHAFLQVSATANENTTALANFGHTAQLWLGLPAGTPFSSRSGVFLTEAPSLPVPEPHSAALLATGLLLLALWRRRAAAPGLLLVLGVLLVPAAARADASALVVVATGTPSFLHPFDSAADEVLGSGAARASLSGQVRPAGADPFSWVAGAWGSTRRGAAGAEIVVDRGDRAVRGEVNASGLVSDTIHIDGSRPGIALFSAGVFGSFASLSGSRFQADGTLTVVTPAGSNSAEVRFLWTKDGGSLQPSVVASEGSTGIRQEPGNLSATLHVPVLVQPGDDVLVQLVVAVNVRPGDNDQAVANFGHTMQLAIALPDGLSYTSASGDFMVDAQPLPVPEPAQWLLMLAGLGGLWRLVLARRSPPGGRPGPAVAVLAGLLFAGSSQAEVSASVGVGGAVQEQRYLPGSVLLLAEHCGQRYQVLSDCRGGLGGPFYDWAGSSLARADDQRGVLGGRAFMAYADGSEWVNPSRPPVGAGATAMLEGELLVGGSQGGTLALQMDLDGHFDGDGLARAGVGASLYVSVLRAATGRRDVDDLASIHLRWQPGDADATLTWPASGDVPIDDLDHRGVRAALRAQVPLAPGDIVRVNGFLNTSATGYLPGTDILADFGNTAQLSLRASPGLVLSPVEAGFLQLAPVPEPGTWALLSGGVLLLLPGLRARRRPVAAGAASVLLPALLLVAATPASAQSAHAAVWNSSNFNNPNPAANLRSEEVTTGRANVGHSALTNPFIDRVEWVAGASADLRRGSVGVEIQADRVGNPASTQGDTVWARGELNETLTFTGSRAGVVDFAVGISGSFQSVDGSAFRADGFLFAGGLSGQLDFHWVNNLSSPDVSVFASPGTTGIRSDPAGLFGTLHLLRLVQPGETLAVQLRMELRVGPGAHDRAVANFGHTAQLGITVPAGMSFTSASGDFMVDAPPLPVPEPASGALLLAGLGLLWVRGRQPTGSRRLPLLPMLLAAVLVALPAMSQAQASASVTLSGIATPVLLDADVSQPERASALLSGGGPLDGPSNDIDGHGDFLVSATADLARGTLRSAARLNIVGQGGAQALTQAGLFDTLVFDGSRPVPLQLRLAVHGAFSDSGNGFHEVVARLQVGGQTEQATLQWYGWTYQTQHNHPVRVVGGQAISTEAANTIVWLTVDQMVLPGVPVDVVALLRLDTTAGANSLVNLNFGNTAQLWLQVPEGVTYTSASGRFMTAAPVPEPGTVALWLAGLLLAAMLRRRRG